MAKTFAMNFWDGPLVPCSESHLVVCERIGVGGKARDGGILVNTSRKRNAAIGAKAPQNTRRIPLHGTSSTTQLELFDYRRRLASRAGVSEDPRGEVAQRRHGV